MTALPIKLALLAAPVWFVTSADDYVPVAPLPPPDVVRPAPVQPAPRAQYRHVPNRAVVRGLQRAPQVPYKAQGPLTFGGEE